MIVSHSNKFIFLKPRKVASTSLEINLAQSCSEQDIVTPISSYKPNTDSDVYIHQARNHEGLINHSTPREIIGKIGLYKWFSYKKITIVRNPYDLVVSWYWYKTEGKISFEEFVLNMPKLDNEQYYFYNPISLKIANFYIKFENLDQDYKSVCEFLDIEYEPLIQTKDKHRKDRKPYRDLHTKKTKEIIYNKYQQTIKTFKYEF